MPVLLGTPVKEAGGCYRKAAEGVPWRPSGLRILRCYCSSSGRCCGSGLIPSSGTSTCCEHIQKGGAGKEEKVESRRGGGGGGARRGGGGGGGGGAVQGNKDSPGGPVSLEMPQTQTLEAGRAGSIEKEEVPSLTVNLYLTLN